MSTAPKYIPHYTVADYEQWEGDWELWDGIPVAMTPSPFGRHQHCAAQLVRHLGNAIEAGGCDVVVLSEIDWIISDDTVVRPDVVVLCGAPPETHVVEAPAIVVEILSPATAARDRTEKLRLYSENKVDHYLIVDPELLTVDLYQRSGDGDFLVVESGETLEFNVCGGCSLNLPVASIF